MISKGFLIHTQSLRLGLFLNQYRVVGNYRDGLLSPMAGTVPDQGPGTGQFNIVDCVNKMRVFKFEKVSKRDGAGKGFRINLFTYNIPWFNYTVKIR